MILLVSASPPLFACSYVAGKFDAFGEGDDKPASRSPDACPGYAANIAKYDGSGWSVLKSTTGGGLNGDVASLTSLGGRVIAGGEFTSTADGKTGLGGIVSITP